MNRHADADVRGAQKPPMHANAQWKQFTPNPKSRKHTLKACTLVAGPCTDILSRDQQFSAESERRPGSRAHPPHFLLRRHLAMVT